jgi:hypothetical protein
VSVAVAWVVFASLLSPPLLVLLLVAWLCGAHVLMLVPVVVWLLATVWMAANVGLRHHRRGERFLEALVAAPWDILDQLARLTGARRAELRGV